MMDGKFTIDQPDGIGCVYIHYADQSVAIAWVDPKRDNLLTIKNPFPMTPKLWAEFKLAVDTARMRVTQQDRTKASRSTKDEEHG